MEIIVSKLTQHFEGLKVVLKENDHISDIALINGNRSDFYGPIILLNLDQHIVYGLSHPEVISRIYTKGPQQLLTNKEIGHNLFEHGMKASLGKVKFRLNSFLTTLDTFYTLTTSTSNLTLVVGKDNRIGCLITPFTTHHSILLCNYGFELKDADKYRISSCIEVDSIKTYVSCPILP